MQIYTTSEASFAKIRRDIIIRLTLFSGTIFCLIIGWEVWQNRSNNEVNLFTLLLFVIIIITTSCFSIARVISQQKKIWNSIRINLANDYISRQQIRIPEVKIYRSQITTVEEYKTGILVKTADKGRAIAIPIQLDRADYLEIKETLTDWHGKEIVPAKQDPKEMGMAIAYCLAFLVLFLSFNIWLNFILGIGIIIYNVYGYKLVNNNVSIDPQIKKAYKRTLAITTFMVLINTFGKLYLLSAIKNFQQEVENNRQALLLDRTYLIKNIGRVGSPQFFNRDRP